MRVLKRRIEGKNGSGVVKIQPDEPEDIYHLFNIISTGDAVIGSTIRNVVRESTTGSVMKNRIRMNIKINVERIEFDSEMCTLRLNGRNMEEHEHIKMGQYHTLDIEKGHPLTIEKDCWDFIFMKRLDEACDPSKSSEIAAVVMQDGLAHVCLITNSMTLTRARIEHKAPSKKEDQKKTEKYRSSFFQEIYDAIKKHVNFDVVRVVLLGSPGFLKDDFFKYLDESATRLGDTVLSRAKAKFLRAHTSSGHKRAIAEMMEEESVYSQLVEVKAAAEVKALQRFYDVLSMDQDRACYGYKHVAYADDQLAIEELLVTDKLFKAVDMGVRQKYVALVERVKEHGGKVFIFSSLHSSGAQLDLYTGIAATLRYPLPEEQEPGEGEEERDEAAAADEEQEQQHEAYNKANGGEEEDVDYFLDFHIS